MILTVDIGNTAITLGGFEGDILEFISRISAVPEKTEDEYAVGILDVLRLHGIDKACFTGAIIASVVPPLNSVIDKAIRTVLNVTPLFVGPGIKSCIGIRCDIPSSVGADLIAASVAAHFLYGSPALIVDVGTATKMTVVNKKGDFVGTSIIPGVLMGLNALSEQTAQLPKISLDVPPSVIGKNTADCMRSGVMYGNASLIDGMIDRINREFGEELRVIATGELASLIIPMCDHSVTIDEHLVLQGLNILYKKNKA